MVQSYENEQPNYTSKFGLVNIMSDEEKSDYKKFNATTAIEPLEEELYSMLAL